MQKIHLRKADVFLQEIPQLTRKEQSTLARNIVFQYTDSKPNRSYKVNNYYWSASYTQGMVAVVLSKNKVGIDVEKIVERDQALFNLSSKIANWETFYRVWTGKEAIIKAFNLNLKDHERIIYQNNHENETTFLYDQKPIKIKTIIFKDYFISICFVNINQEAPDLS